MKKKIMALSIVFAVSASFLPSTSAVLAQSDSDLFTEDFESYEVGTIIDATEDQSSATRVGNIDCQLRAGDKLEIAQENGNKYLKITRASESSTNSHIKYYFPETFSGNKYAISYDFKPEAHNKHFARFGSLIREGGAINITTVTYGNNFYANSSTGNSAYYVGNLLKTANYTGSQYATITQTVDLARESNNYEFHAVYPGSSGFVEKTVTNTASQLGITGLAWAINKHTDNGYNGPDDATATGVYRIDNIVVKAVPSVSLVSTNVQNNGAVSGREPFTMTFSEEVSAAAVTLEANGAAMAASDYTVTVSGATVSVVPTAGWRDGVPYKVNVGTVTAASGSAENIDTAFDLTGSSYLFIEDFEDWTVGTISEAAADQSAVTKTVNERIGYQLKAGDKIAIAQEANGNKYLEITRASTSTSYSRYAYYFPQTYSGKKYAVSYDFMPEEHNQQFRHFGSLWKQNADGTQTGVIKQILSWGKGIYYNNDPSKNAFADVLNTAKYTGSGYATITQTIDFTSLSSSTLKAALPDGTVTEHSVGTSTAPQGVGLYGLLWDIQVNQSASYNGGDDHTIPSVYRIDNIKVKAVALELVSTNVSDNGKISGSNPFEMTFSDVVSTADVTLDKNGFAMDSSDYTVTISDKTVSVVPTDGWEEGAVYTVNVGQVTAVTLAPFGGAAFTLVASNSLFIEDFEGYPIGVIASGDINTVSTTRNPGGLVYKLIEGDTLEVVEKDGSKVLRLTAKKGDTTERRLILDFDRHYGDSKAYNVSFDYYVENNSVYFSDFGSVCDDKISGHADYVHKAYYNPIKVISSYRDNLYFDRVTSENKFYAENLLDADDAFWKSQSMTIDFSQDPRPFMISTTKTSDGSSLAKKSLTVSQTFGKQTADNISSIAWDFQSNSTSSGWDGRDEGSGVYYIDNVKITTARLALVNSNVASGQEVSVDTDINLEFNGAVPKNVADYITITKNDEPLSDTEYSVSLSEDNRTVTICPANRWDYKSTYIIGINSIENPAFEAFEGTAITFDTGEKPEDFYVDNINVTRTGEGNVFDVSATIYNNTENEQSYQPIIIMIDKSSGSLTGLKIAQSSALAGNSSGDISIQGVNADLDNVDCELLIWDNLTNLMPLTEKKTLTE